jgi:hypothetical protein
VGKNIFPSVENAYQAMKCERVEDVTHFVDVTPGRAKRLGRSVFMRADWSSVKVEVMWSLLRAKFRGGTLLDDALKRTAPAELVEGNGWNDRFWGQCPVGVGENHLGRMLMCIRDV